MAGRTPELQQNWQSSEKSQNFMEHPVNWVSKYVILQSPSLKCCPIRFGRKLLIDYWRPSCDLCILAAFLWPLVSILEKLRKWKICAPRDVPRTRVGQESIRAVSPFRKIWWRKRTVSELRNMELMSSWEQGGLLLLAAILKTHFLSTKISAK